MPRSLSRSKSPPYRRRYSLSPVGHRYSRSSRRDRSRSPYSNSYSRRKSSLSPQRGKSRSRAPRRQRSPSTPRRYRRRRSRNSTKSPIHKSQSPSLSTGNKIAIERLRKETIHKKRKRERLRKEEKEKKRIKKSTMADLPKEISASEFQISFKVGVQIGESNMYLGSIEDNIPATYFLYDKKGGRNNQTYWHDFGVRENKPFILRVYGKADYIQPGRKERVLLFTEVINYTLEDWATKYPLLHSSNSTRLSAPFIRILLDILHGLIYFRINLRIPFGKIVSHNIYIVGGRAKLGNVTDPKRKKNSFKPDIRSFCHMIKKLFKTNKEEIPLELSQLFDSLLMSVTTRIRNNENFLLNSVNHPILCTPKQRGERRHLAFDSIDGRSLDCKSRINMKLKEKINDARRKFPSIQGPYWINNVNEEEFLKVLYYRRPPIQTHKQQPPLIQAALKEVYDDTPLEFLRFSRNVGEHAQDNNKRRLCDDIKDRKLTLYLPGFLSVLHDILTRENIFVIPLPIIN